MAIVVFLHEVKAGPASRSYGIDVAKLAGMPAEVIRDARRELERLEKERTHAAPQADLFAAVSAPAESAAVTAASTLLDEIAQLDADDISPREAHKLAEAHRARQTCIVIPRSCLARSGRRRRPHTCWQP